MTKKIGGRPAGPVRQALLLAAQAFAADDLPATFDELAERARVGRLIARETCWSMVKAGDLRVVGSVLKPWSKRPMALFRAIDTASPTPHDPTAVLAASLSMWFSKAGEPTQSGGAHE
jgi:hypothetical protein